MVGMDTQLGMAWKGAHLIVMVIVVDLGLFGEVRPRDALWL